MLLITYILFVLFSACFARHAFDIDKQYEKQLNAVDAKFYSIFQRLLAKTPVEGLDAVGSLFGWLAGISIGIYTIGLLIGPSSSAWANFLIIMFFYTLAGWVAIKWFTQRFSWHFLQEMAALSLLPMLMPVMNLLTGMEYIEMAYAHMMELISIFGIPQTENIWLMGLTVSLFMLALVIAYCLLVTLVFAPIVFTGWMLLHGSLKCGQYIDKFWKGRALTPVCFIGLMLVSAYGHFN